MADPEHYFEKAVAAKDMAQKIERESGKLKAALENWIHAVELIDMFLKYSKNELIKPKVRQSRSEWMAR